MYRMKGRTRRSKRSRRKISRRRRKQRGGSAELLYMSPTSQIKVFTSADARKPTLDTLLESLKRHNYSYEVLGVGKPWSGFITKMENYVDGIQRYSQEKGPDAIAIFIDAFDVLCIKDSDKMLAAYQSRPRQMPIVFGAEICCFDNCDRGVLEWYDYHNVAGGQAAVKAALTQKVPGSDLLLLSPTPVFANSGFIMGPAEALLQLFKGMIDSQHKDDQVAAGTYITQNLDKIDLNIEETLVRNKLLTREKLPDEDGTNGPGFLHFPGMRDASQQSDLVEKYKQYA